MSLVCSLGTPFDFFCTFVAVLFCVCKKVSKILLTLTRVHFRFVSEDLLTVYSTPPQPAIVTNQLRLHVVVIVTNFR